MAIDGVSITAIIISVGTCLTGLIAGIKFVHCHSGCCDIDIKGKDKTPPNTPHFIIDEPPIKEEKKNISTV